MMIKWYDEGADDVVDDDDDNDDEFDDSYSDVEKYMWMYQINNNRNNQHPAKWCGQFTSNMKSKHKFIICITFWFY